MGVIPEPSDEQRFAYAVSQKIMTQTRLGASVISRMGITPRDVSDTIEGSAKFLRLELEAYVLTDHLVKEDKTVKFDEEVILTRPATWWDHCKIEHADDDPLWRWFVKRWPPKMVEESHRLTQNVVVRFEAKALYPYSDQVLPEFGKPTIYETHGVRPGVVRRATTSREATAWQSPNPT